jgi:hypothetical protein
MRIPGATVVLFLAGFACGDSAAPHDASESTDGSDAEADGGEDAPEADGGEATADDGGGDEADAEAEIEWTSWDGDVPDVPRMDKAAHLASCMRTRTCFPENRQQLATCTAAFANINGREIGFVLALVAECVNAAGADCAAVRACLSNGEPATPCVPLSTPDRCDGTVLRQCSRASALDFVFDCARLGLGCYINTDDEAVCGLGTCDPAAFRWSCRGDTVVSCDLGVISLALCDSADLACVDDASGGRCAGTGAACTDASDPRHCAGDRIVGCIAGYSADVDCNYVIPRWTCGDREGTAGCVESGSACVAQPLFGSDIDESCDGEAVVSCLDGWIESTSCAAYGLGPCTVIPEGHAARCTAL